MLESIYTDGVFTQERVRPYLSQPAKTSGVDLGSQSIFRYSQRSSDYPTIILPEPIYDNANGVIRPGYYELAISDMRDFLILIEGKQPRAVIPIFKIEEDAAKPPPYIETRPTFRNKWWARAHSVEPPLRTADEDYNVFMKGNLKEKRLREVVNKQRARVGQQPDLPQVYMEAVLEYVPKGDYYLIKYERGGLRAWGAFKG
jgi:hypothetical protein